MKIRHPWGLRRFVSVKVLFEVHLFAPHAFHLPFRGREITFRREQPVRPGQLQHGGEGGVRGTGCPTQSHRRFHSLSRRYICTHPPTHTHTYTHVHIPSPLILSPLAVLPVGTHAHIHILTRTHAHTHLSSLALPLICKYTHARTRA